MVVARALDGVAIGEVYVAVLVVEVDLAFGITQGSYSEEGGMEFVEDVSCTSFRREEAWKWEVGCVGGVDVLLVGYHDGHWVCGRSNIG